MGPMTSEIRNRAVRLRRRPEGSPTTRLFTGVDLGKILVRTS